MPFRNCDECGCNCLSDWINIIRCDYHYDADNDIKLVCNDCKPDFGHNDNWKMDISKDHGIDIVKLEHSNFTNYKKCNDYTIIKINERNYIKCNDCIRSFIEYNMPWELEE